MAQEANPTTTTGASGATVVPAQATDGQAQGAGDKAQGQEQFDSAYVKELRQEAADYRRKLREAETRLKTLDDAQLSEAEKAQKRIAELEQQATEAKAQLAERALKFDVQAAATKLGIVDADAAYRLLDVKALELADDGTPKNVEAALRALVAAKPYLLGQAATAATNPARGSSTKLTLEQIKGMSAEEINARWPEVQASMAGK